MATKIKATDIKNNNNRYEVELENGLEVVIELEDATYSVTVEVLGEASDHSNMKDVNKEVRGYEKMTEEEIEASKAELAKMRKTAKRSPSDYVPISETVHESYTFSTPEASFTEEVEVNELQKRKLDAMLNYLTDHQGETISWLSVGPADELYGEGELIVTVKTTKESVLGDYTEYFWKIGRLGGWLTMDGMGRWQEGKENWHRSLADWHGGVFCRECNKVLTDPTSVAIGIGPECCTKFGISWDKAAAFVAKGDKEGLEEYLSDYR
jgi:hypothetical protein